MSNFPRQRRNPTGRIELPEIITPSHVKFITEASGPAEARTKATLRSIFQQQTPQIVRRAYLVRLAHGEPPMSSVVVCLRHVEHIEGTLQRGFKHMFGEIRRTGDFYDSMIIGEDEEHELGKVCKPFYDAAQQED